MKSRLFILITILFSSCINLFDKKEDKIFIYKLNKNTNLEIYSVSYGATTKDHTEIRRTSASESYLLKKIDGDYVGYKVTIFREKNNLFKITFTDTSVFKGMSRSVNFNIDERENQQ